MKQRRRVAAGLLAATMMAAGGACAAPEARWVDATRLALRAQPSVQAPVLGWLVTNTPVAVDARSGEWCELTHEGKRGFVVCRFLAAQPLKARQLDEGLRNAGSRAAPEQLQKRFWIEPSVARLMAYGVALDGQLFAAEAESGEARAPRPRRAEFEAMKQRLRDGWTPPVTLPAADLAPADAASLAVLPRISPSLMRGAPIPTLSTVTTDDSDPNRPLLSAAAFDGVAGEPDAALASLLAQASGGASVLRVLAFGAPLPLHDGGFAGAWDLGGAEVALAPGGIDLTVIDEEGGARQARITAFDTRTHTPDVGCDFVGHFVLDRPAGTGFVALLQPRRHGLKSVRRLLARELPADAPWARALLQQVNAESEYARVVDGKPGRLLAFDLDEDGIADLARLSIEVDGGDLMLGTAFTTYFNLGGRWHVAGRFLPKTCGC